MPFEPTKTRTWKPGATPLSGTPARGTYFDAEFNQNYGNDNFIKDVIDGFYTYEVAAGEAVTAGKVVEFINGYIQNFKGELLDKKNESVVFESANTAFISAVALANDKVLVAYRDVGNSDYGTAIVLSISGTIITAGAAVVFEAANTDYCSSVALAADKVLVVYRDRGNSDYGTSIILSISGTVITPGLAVVFESASSAYFSAVALATDKVLVAYEDVGNSNYGTAIVLSISGTVITPGSAVVFESASSSYISAVALASDKVLVAYTDVGNSSYGTAIVLSISGTVITPGLAVVFESASSAYFSAVALASDKVLVAYTDVGNSSYGTAIVLSISGTTITPGIAVVFWSASISHISAVALADDKVLVAYRNVSNSIGTCRILYVTSVFSIGISGSAIAFNLTNTDYISSVVFAADKVLIAYRDLDNSNHGTATIVEAASFSKSIGIAAETKTAGEDCVITKFANNKFVTTGLSGLSAAQRYYAASNGDLVTAPLTVLQLVLEIFTPINLMVGLGVDATTLLVDNLLYGGDI